MLAFALALCTAGALLLTWRSPNQAWRGRRLPAGAGWLGLLLVILSFWPALHAMRPLAAVFLMVTWLMLAFSLLPTLVPLLRPRQRDDPGGARNG